MSDRVSTVLQALALVNAVGAELEAGPFAHQGRACPLERIPALTEAEADRRASLARGWQADIAGIAVEALPPELALCVRVAAATADRMAREHAWYWHVHDPIRIGFFALFGPTAYCGGWYLATLTRLLGQHRFERRGDGERYLGLIADVVGLVTAMTDRLRGQLARGIAMPAPQLAQALPLVAALGPRLQEQLLPEAGRLAALPDADRVFQRARALLRDELGAALRGLAECLHEAGAAAPDTVGIAQYAGGAEIYAELVRQHTTLDLSPEQIHATGHARIADIRDHMARTRDAAGFHGSDMEYRAAIAADPRWTASGADGVAAHFRRSIDRISPHLATWFHARPAAEFGVAPLPDALAGSMTFGYYQVPDTAGGGGRYLFNARNLTRSGLSHVPALTFHELAPGHHIHLAGQAEDSTLPSVIRHNAFNAFNEGWAEYAAALAGEHGLYSTPEERFGRLMMDAFLTCRLVVDTGMNALGWSLEQGRAYLRANAFMGEHEIATESIRYACDQPAQALAYKLGDTFLLDQRERMRAALGAQFDLRDFHDAVLCAGAIPLPLVANQIDVAIDRLSAASHAVARHHQAGLHDQSGRPGP